MCILTLPSVENSGASGDGMVLPLTFGTVVGALLLLLIIVIIVVIYRAKKRKDDCPGR